MPAERSKNNGDIASFYDVYILGVSSVISGLLIFWNAGFATGFWEFSFTTVLIVIAYLALVLSLAEMISILPFSGGSYGFSRVTMGPYIGFIIGCYDTMSIIYFVAQVVQSFCLFVSLILVGPEAPNEWQPLYWLLFYVTCLIILIPLGRWYFTFVSTIGTLSILLILIYVLVTADNQNFDKYVMALDRHPFFEGGMKSFMQTLPISTWMFIGIDLVCLVCDDTKDAMHVVPKAIVAALVTLIILAFLLIVTCAANAPGIVEVTGVIFPLNAGYSAAFGISDRMATILSMPAIFINMYAVIYAYGRQICAMSRSHLLPTPLSWTTKDNVPYVALLFGSLLGYSILLGLYYNETPEQYAITLNDLFLASMMCSFSVYIVSLCSFIVFRYKYSSLLRHYVNPFGVPSAVVGILIFAFTFVGVAFFQEGNNYRAVTMFTVFTAGMTAYYWLYARSAQCFSPEEQSILFAVYVIKSNSRKKTIWNRFFKKVSNVIDKIDPHHHIVDALSSHRRGAGSGGSKSRGGSGSKGASKSGSKGNSQINANGPTAGTTLSAGSGLTSTSYKVVPFDHDESARATGANDSDGAVDLYSKLQTDELDTKVAAKLSVKREMFDSMMSAKMSSKLGASGRNDNSRNPVRIEEELVVTSVQGSLRQAGDAGEEKE